MTPTPWQIAIMVAVLAGAAASTWLWLVRRRQLETAAGIDALAGMHRREFSRFVVDAMRHRGFEVAAGQAGAQGLQSDVPMRRDRRRWLLSCRHGSAGINAAAVAAMVDAMAVNGAIDGVLATTGEIDSGARRAAANARIEVLAGAGLWKETGPLLPESLREDVRAGARDHSKRLIAFSWLGALALGIAITLVLDRGQDAGATETRAAPTAAASPAAAGSQTVVEAVEATATATAPPTAVIATDTPADAAVAVADELQQGETPQKDPLQGEQSQEEQDRREIARMVSELPGIDDADWASRSTLLIHLQAGADVDTAGICALLADNEAVATSRLQLQPPPGSDQAVRFRLCRQGM